MFYKKNRGYKIYYYYFLIFLMFEILSSSFLFHFFLLNNIYLPVIFSFILFFGFFVIKWDEESNLIVFFLILLFIFELLFCCIIYLYLGFFPSFIIGDFFVWNIYAFTNKLFILFFAIIIFDFIRVDQSLSLFSSKTFLSAPFSFSYIPYKSSENVFVKDYHFKLKFLFFFIAIFSFIMTLFCSDLFLLCFFFEIASVCLIYLFFYHGFKSKEAVVKFFVYSALMNHYFFLV